MFSTQIENKIHENHCPGQRSLQSKYWRPSYPCLPGLSSQTAGCQPGNVVPGQYCIISVAKSVAARPDLEPFLERIDGLVIGGGQLLMDNNLIFPLKLFSLTGIAIDKRFLNT
jgi:hypothetical protein